MINMEQINTSFQEKMKDFKEHLASIFYLKIEDIEMSLPTGHSLGNYYTFSFKTSKFNNFVFKKILDEHVDLMEWRIEPVSMKNIMVYIYVKPTKN